MARQDKGEVRFGRPPFIVEDVSDERRSTHLLAKEKIKILRNFFIRASVGFGGDFDEKSFEHCKEQVVKLLDKHRGSKVELGLICDMVRVNP